MTPTLRRYIPAFIVLAAVGILHFLGTYYHLYFIFPLYDIMLHFLGGLWFGLTAVWIAQTIFHVVPQSFFRSLVWVLSATFFVGIVWEVFEFHNGLATAQVITAAGLSYWADTIKDLCVDTLGGVVAFVCMRYWK